MAELAAVLGILPTSQILMAGGGIIGVKLAMMLRFLALIGLIDDKYCTRNLTGSRITPEFTGPSPANTTRIVEVSPESGWIPGGSYFGFPDVLHHFGLAADKNQNQTSVKNETLKPISLKPVVVVKNNSSSASTDDNDMDFEDSDEAGSGFTFDNETAYFPIPGLRIGFDNRTGKSFLMFDEGSLTPTVFMPPDVASKTGIVHPNVTTTTTVSDQGQDDAGIRSDISYLYYPVIPNNVRHPLLIKFSNGSLMPFDESSHQKDRTERSVSDLDSGRTTSISSYFSLISTLDMTDCFSRLLCEIGWSQAANETMYGQYGRTVDRFFDRLNGSDFEPDSRAAHYIGRFQFGHDLWQEEKNITDCRKGSPCQQDLMSLIQPIMG